MESNRVIDIDKKYRTRNGKAVRILAVDRCGEHYPVVALVQRGDKEAIDEYTKEGHFYRGGYLDGFSDTNELDLVEVTGYEDFKRDDRVVVWNNDGDIKERGYFAGIDNDQQPTAWKDGATYWSSAGRMCWDHCIKAE